RVQKVRSRKPASRVRLSPTVIELIEQLGGQYHPSEPQATSITIAGESWDLPEALRQLIFDISWPRGDFFWHKYGDTFSEGVSLGMHVTKEPSLVVDASFADNYECAKNQPLLPFAITDQYCYYLFKLDATGHANPKIYYIDHDDFWDLQAHEQPFSLVRFLSSLSKKEE
ncbi:MAG TPA: hypothetical protein VFN35_15700, partial [Ktedonobacteraceae bacterium]|nr:hypothetical protein [Ktedonobacteraceae bacterium]